VKTPFELFFINESIKQESHSLESLSMGLLIYELNKWIVDYE